MKNNPYPFRKTFMPRSYAKRALVDIQSMSYKRGYIHALLEDENNVPARAFGDRTREITRDWQFVARLGSCPAIELGSVHVMDLCQEEVRARSRFEDRPTPLEQWNECSAETVDRFTEHFRKTKSSNRPTFTPENFRYFCGRVLSYCAHFRGDTIHDFLHWAWRTSVYRGSVGESQRKMDWLDPCAGWGCRLLAACTHNKVRVYHGFDPNTSLMSGHGQMMKLVFGAERVSCAPGGAWVDDGGVRVQYLPWESGHRTLQSEYDLVFTSPPFYRKETYFCSREDKPQQAGESFPTKRDFLEGFMKELVHGSHRHLRRGGILALHLPADGEVDRAAQRHADEIGFRRYGIVCAQSKLSSQTWRPIFVWIK